MVALVLGFMFVVPGIIYLIYYGLKRKNCCPICYSKVKPIDYNYPPFKGTPDSYDPSLIYVGKIVRTESTFENPEGDFVAVIPDNQESFKQQSNSSYSLIQNFCKLCGSKLEYNMKFCPFCGSKIRD